jgi:hypothetical protein
LVVLRSSSFVILSVHFIFIICLKHLGSYHGGPALIPGKFKQDRSRHGSGTGFFLSTLAFSISMVSLTLHINL